MVLDMKDPVTPIIIGSLGLFKLTDQSLKELEDENIPKEITALLKNLENKIYTSEEQFVNALKNTIGEEDTDKYKSLILIYARSSEQLPYSPREIAISDNYAYAICDGFHIINIKDPVNPKIVKSLFYTPITFKGASHK